MDHEVETLISIRKRKLTHEQRVAARALLRMIDATAIIRGGQLIIHFGPSHNAFFGEVQERRENFPQIVVDKVA